MLTGQIRFAQKVGVAPSTTTMTLGCGCSPRGLGVQCDPVPSIQERDAWIGRPRWGSPTPPAPAVAKVPKKRRRRLNPYGSEVEMRGLGVPSESYAWMTGRVVSQPPGSPRGTTALVFSGSGVIGEVDTSDQWNTGDTNRLRTHGTTVIRINPRRGGGFTETLLGRGLGIVTSEAARSLTGALGTVPNDDELARNLCYTPVHSGWIYGNTPTGERYYADGLYGPAAAALLSDDPGVIADVVKIQRRQMIFQGITTAAIVGMAAASIWTALRGKKRRRGRRARR